MPATEVICPACLGPLKRSPLPRKGELCECPLCATEFHVGMPAPGADAGYEEADDELEVVEGEARTGRRKGGKRRRKSGSADLGNWLRLGFMHWPPMVMPSIGFCILYVILYFLAALVFGLLSLIPIIGPFLTLFCVVSVMVSWSAGMTLVSIQQLQGKRWSFGDFFSGSQWWLPLFGNWVLLEILYLILSVGPGVGIGFLMRAFHLPDAVGQLISSGVGMLLYFLVYPLTWMFSWQLILDGNYGPLEAITEGAQMALPHYFKLLLLALITLLIRFIGVMLCLVGFTVAWPLAVLIESAAYLRLTGRRVVEKTSQIN